MDAIVGCALEYYLAKTHWRGRSDHEPGNEPETLVCWQLEEYKGDTLRLLIDDDVNGPWGFIGVGRIEFLKSPC